MTQDAPVRKTDNGAYFSAFAQDDFRDSSARHLEPRRPLRRAVPVHRSAGPQARLRAGAEVGGQSDRAGRPAVPRRCRREPRHRAHRLQQHRAAPRRGVGSEGRRPHGRARGVRHVLRQHHRQRVEHDRRQPAVHRPAVVPDRLHAVRSVSQPARRRRSISVQLHTRRRRGSRCRRRCSVRRWTSCGRSATRPTSRWRRSSARASA